ncbi:hypothetical protein V2J09_000116 [Rumex salicifolius]
MVVEGSILWNDRRWRMVAVGDDEWRKTGDGGRQYMAEVKMDGGWNKKKKFDRTKVLVCCSVESILASNMDFYTKYLDIGHEQFIPREVEQNIMEGRCHMEQLVLDPSDKGFLNEFSSYSLLYEARKLNILSEPSYRKLLFHEYVYSHLECSLCANGNEIAANVHHMIEKDWLYLAQLSKWKKPNAQHYVEESFMETHFSNYAVLSTKQALASLKKYSSGCTKGIACSSKPQRLIAKHTGK